MPAFETMHLPERPDAMAPDGSDVRILLRTERGSMAHFELAPGCISKAAVHRTVDEIWYFLSGKGQMWREQHGTVLVTDVSSGVCITIPCGTQFQFRASGDEPLCIVGVTMPPWPGGGEAAIVPGAWQPTV
jgi:mannose-6-phosphate isomerase-like protein (cupin superfamily)